MGSELIPQQCMELSAAFPVKEPWLCSGILQIKARLALAAPVRAEHPQNHCWECLCLILTLFSPPFGSVH